jgi:PhzF family phenazine biosynthesis protein
MVQATRRGFMETTIYQVDAFTDEPFSGNPAAVCILEEQRPDSWMQDIAREMNLSETAFLLKQEDGYRLRWFTPETEVDLCGHATLASAHILWETDRLDTNDAAVFDTLSGILKARRSDAGIELDFPVVGVQPVTKPTGLDEALGVNSSRVFRSSFFYLVEVDSEETLRALRPDYGKLRSKSPDRAVIVTSRADSKSYDFVSRCFAPNVGIDEDPVTGSAHCCLAPYWSERFGRNELTAYQASARGGALRVRVEGDRVFISGRAVTVMRAELVES